MAHITYVTPDGQRVAVDATAGTLMTAAVQHGVDGIEGACGGVCSCGTCHVEIDTAWVDRVGPPHPAEADMLEVTDRVTPASRLGCQVPIRPELDGLVVRVIEP